MPVDQNVYALSISLQFDASEAFDTLDDFGQKLTNLEDEVSSSAQKAIGSLGQIASEAVKYLEDIGQHLKDMDTTSFKLQANFADASKELKDQFNTGEDRREDLEEEFEFWEKTYKLQEDLGKELQTHLDLNNQFLDLTTRIIGAVKQKNIGHAEQNGLLRTDRDLAQGFNEDLDGTVKKTDDAAKKAAQMTISWQTVWGWIKKADEDTEKFTAMNYRHYGSQQALVQGARELAMVNGIAYEQAVEAYAVMGNLKVPREELGKYAQVVSLASRTTGVGIQATGEYANRLRTAGMTLQQTERQLAFAGEAMRKYGLNTSDVNALVGTSAANAKNAARIFGQIDLSKWEESRFIMAGFAREAGHSAEEMASFENWILNDVAALEQFKALTNTTEQGVDGYRLAMLRAGIAAETQMAALEARQAAGQDVAAEMLAIQQSLIQTQFGGNRAAYEAARVQGRLATQNNMTGVSIEEVNRLTEIYASTLNDQAAEANNTFTAQLKLLNDKVMVAGASIMQFVADAILPLLRALNWLIQQIGWVIEKISEFIRWMEAIPVIGKVVTFLKWATGIVMALGLALIFLSGTVISLSTVFGGFSGLTTRMAKGVQAFTDILLNLVKAMGQAIVIILTSIGDGLQALGNSIKGVIVPLVALGLALMLTGIGAYFFALSVQIIAEMGWAAIPAMIGMILAIGLLGLVLVGLAMLIQGPVAVGLIVLAIAIFAVGAAALMMGAGIYLAALGLTMVADVLSFGLILKFGLLGLAMVSLGMMAVAAAPGIYALGVGMFIIATAALVMSAAFWLVAAAIKMIGSDALPALAESMLQSAVKFAEAGTMMMVAGLSLAVGGLLLAAALVVIAIVAVGLLAAGIVLLAGSALMMYSGGLLMAAGAMILVGGLAVLIGGTGLYLGLLILSLSVVLIGVIGFGLTIGAIFITAGAAALLIAGAAVFVAGLAMLIGAALLLGAGMLMVEAVPLFTQAGVGYIASVAQILTGSVMLAGAAVFMASAGLLLAVGSSALISAGVALAIGLFFLSDSSQQMFQIGTRIGIGGLMMLAGAQALVTAASMLGESAGYIDSGLETLKGLMPKVIEAANQMLPAGTMLRVAAFQLAIGCVYISIAGHALQDGVFSLLSGAIFLQMAVEILSSLAPVMLTSSVQVRTAAAFLLGAALGLLPASILMAASGVLLATGVTLVLWGARFLLVAAIMLLAGSMIMAPAAGLLMVAMQFLSPAAGMLLSAGPILIDGALVLLVASGVLLVASLALLAASVVIVYASMLYLGAMATILTGSIFLATAAGSIFVAAIQLAVAGEMLPLAAMNILSSMRILAEAGEMAGYSSGLLILGAVVLTMAAGSILASATALLTAGFMMQPAAWTIYTGLLWLEFAVSRFSKTVGKVEKVGAAMSMLAGSFQMLSNTPLTGLREISAEALDAVPNIEKLGTGLSVAAKKLDEGVSAFQGPADRLNTILTQLTETITAFGQGLNLTDDVGRLADMLENYASLLEGASERIETAVVTKAVPAMRAAEEAGIEETVRSEAISTVQVVSQTDGAARDAQDETSRQLSKLNETMTIMKDLMVEMQSGGKGELSEILAVLQVYLPGLNKGDAGLGSELNSWAK